MDVGYFIVMIKLIVFDWSGVISDDRRPIYEANMRILEEHGKPRISFEDWLPNTTMNVVGTMRNHGIDTAAETLLEMLRGFYNKLVESGNKPVVYPDALDTISSLHSRGLKMAVLSSHPEVTKEAEEYGLKGFFSLIIENSRDKVHGLKEVCNRLGIEPQDTLYVGDGIHDIKAAKGAGVHSAGILTGYHSEEILKKEEPHLGLLNNLSELKNMGLAPPES